MRSMAYTDSMSEVFSAILPEFTKTVILMLKIKTTAFLISFILTFSALAQDTGVIGPSPYDFTTETWMKPFAQDGFTWGGNSSVFVESTDRIFFLQRGDGLGSKLAAKILHRLGVFQGLPY